MTKNKFKKYLRVQKSGATNMFDIKKVEVFSGLDRKDIIDIMDNYESYLVKYKQDRLSKRCKVCAKLKDYDEDCCDEYDEWRDNN